MIKKSPHIKNYHGIPTLFVEEKPFLALSGEVHNSSASDLNYMIERVWPNIEKLSLNTLVVPIYWEMIESAEGIYDFSHVQAIIQQARKHKMKLILLWFGLWKNALSTYVPEWMKKNRDDYPFVQNKSFEQLYSITPLCKKAVEKDAQAFGKLMAFIKKIDEEDQTVIMVQVENEVGVLGTDFDYSESAILLYEENVPKEVARFASKSGTWSEVFGIEAKEYFMAYYYAAAIEKITLEGIKQYEIPYFVNAWLEKFPYQAGNYPTGGPISRLVSFWRTLAPSISACVPDIYVPNFADICEEYLKDQSFIMIPETRQDVDTVSNLFYAVGKYHILGFAPFGIEDLIPNEFNMDSNILSSLAIDASAFDCRGTAPLLQKAYELLAGLSPLLFELQGSNQVNAFLKKNEGDRGVVISADEINIKITFQAFAKENPRSPGIVIQKNAH